MDQLSACSLPQNLLHVHWVNNVKQTKTRTADSLVVPEPTAFEAVTTTNKFDGYK